MSDFERLVAPFVPALRRYALAQVRQGDRADDLVQDCLERALSRWGQRRPDGDLRAWLFTILHNLVVNEARGRSRRGLHLPLEEAPGNALRIEARQEEGLHHRALLQALAALPDEQRSVLLLVSVEGLSYAETAAVLATPLGTVMSRLFRARERLRRWRDDTVRPVAAPPPLRRVK